MSQEKELNAAAAAPVPESNLFAPTPLGEAISGLIGGLISTTAIYPLDRVKTEQQLHTQRQESTLQILTRVIESEGIGGLYAGLRAEYVEQGITNFVYFYCYSLMKNLLLAKKRALVAQKKASSPRAQKSPTASALSPPVTPKGAGAQLLSPRQRAKGPGVQLDVGTNLAMGCAAGAITQIFATPISVAQKVLQVSAGKETTIIGALASVVQKDGVVGLYRGFMPTLVLTLNPAIVFLVFDRLKHFWVKRIVKEYNKRVKFLEENPHVQDTLPDKPREPSAFELFVMGAMLLFHSPR